LSLDITCVCLKSKKLKPEQVMTFDWYMLHMADKYPGKDLGDLSMEEITDD
jgi:hypothetical protein